MPQFRLRRSRLRGSTNGRLRGNLGIADAVVSAGNAVAGVLLGTRVTTYGNPVPRPRVMLPMAGVTAAVVGAIMDIGAPVVAPGQTTAPRIVPTSPAAPRAVHAEPPRVPRVVGSVTESPDPAMGVTPRTGEQAVAVPDVPEKTVIDRDVPKPRIVGKTKR